MDKCHRLDNCASELLSAARAFHFAADRPGSHAAAHDSLESLEEALQLLSESRSKLTPSGPRRVAGDGRSSRREFARFERRARPKAKFF
jgi:hypothetical protein